MIDTWVRDEVIGDHIVWKRWVRPKGHDHGGVYIWNVTRGDEPPPQDSGYYSREAILRLKNLPIRFAA